METKMDCRKEEGSVRKLARWGSQDFYVRRSGL